VVRAAISFLRRSSWIVKEMSRTDVLGLLELLPDLDHRLVFFLVVAAVPQTVTFRPWARETIRKPSVPESAPAAVDVRKSRRCAPSSTSCTGCWGGFVLGEPNLMGVLYPKLPRIAIGASRPRPRRNRHFRRDLVRGVLLK
jgi:hypothetical protein